MKKSIYLRWLGVAGIELSAGAQVLMLDPYLTRIPFRNLLIGSARPNEKLIRKHIHHCRHVLVTHSHFDHLLDVPFIAHCTGAAIFGSSNTCRLLSVCGVPSKQLHEIDTGDTLQLDRFRVRVFPAAHVALPGFGHRPLAPDLKPPLSPLDFRMDKAFSFHIETDGLQVMIESGKKSAADRTADVLFLQPRMTPPQRTHMLNIVQPRLVIPVHWDDFFRPLSKPLRPGFEPPGWRLPPVKRLNMAEFKRTLQRDCPAVKILIPQSLRTYNLQSLTHAVPAANSSHHQPQVRTTAAEG